LHNHCSVVLCARIPHPRGRSSRYRVSSDLEVPCSDQRRAAPWEHRHVPHSSMSFPRGHTF
jgi:hypothetical protein